MKIVLNDVNDVEDFLKMLSPSYFRLIQKASSGMDALADRIPEGVAIGTPGRLDEVERERPVDTTVEPHPEGATVMSSAGPVDANLAQALGITEQPSQDADGAPHNTDWHSDPAKLTAKGVWRARRGRDEAAYKDWLMSLAVEVAEAAIVADDAEPVATETHALPQDEPESAGDTPEVQADTETAGEAAPTVDHTALIEASQEAAENAPDGTIDLLNAGKEFIKEYGTAKFEALKSAVCPTEDGKGKSIPSMVPAERRLMRACMDNYALYL